MSLRGSFTSFKSGVSTGLRRDAQKLSSRLRVRANLCVSLRDFNHVDKRPMITVWYLIARALTQASRQHLPGLRLEH